MNDGVSDKMLQFLNKLSPEDRAELIDLLYDPNFFIAEDFEDVLAVLRQIGQIGGTE
jgi:hypothetical protein